MKAGSIALAVAGFVALAAGPAEARHRHGCGYGLYYDYSHSNLLSPLSYVFPAANWGPFFQCHMYYTPIVPPPATN